MNKKIIAISVIAAVSTGTATAAIETDLGTASVDFRLRYEGVSQDNTLEDASALTLRTKANFKTISKQGFYGFVELENSFALLDDYNDTNGNGGEFSVVADPETTEIDQAFIGFKTDKLDIKLGRQVITMDSHRFVGHVGWRQDKQTFDAVSASFNASEKLKLSYAYISKRNRIFAEEKDLDSNDHLLNASYKTEFGQLTGYGYLLEVDNDTNNALNTFGARFEGKASEVSYTVELATQTAEAGELEYDTTYMLIEGGTKLGSVNVKAGFESLGSDDGNMGFSTPLATLHKFNGWSDQFLGTPSVGLNDIYATVSGSASSGKWAITLHSYSAAEASDSIDDLGSEINAIYTTKIANKFPIGIKYASYSAGDIKVDTSKLWVWTGYTF
ncbi:alginate export family protein [Psychrosphaera sp. 1_MG-2023]|uniref:alginate export family protein n=1 Tax=Psychrosphaera sp. 1_MG-2023 TaxID=3062643 RepID=UPI0026E3EFEC|nr:alginate export family protein [Psychrosphaera sp. 1_MG-2023]MDO6721147.1 alginate export family protein [Psychrosphaera sp. 1_MG-2023]